MKAYASRTGTLRNLAGLRDAGWGLMVSATGEHRTEGFASYALDNGAYTHWQAWLAAPGQPRPPWHSPRLWAPYIKLLDRFGSDADFAVVPDIPTEGRPSLLLSLQWLPAVMRRVPRALLAVQNGITIPDVAPHLGPNVGVFIGGDDDWKEWATSTWGPWCAARGIWCHVGRVNSARRISLCQLGHCTSFDGSGAARYAVELPNLDNARRHQPLPMQTGPVELGRRSAMRARRTRCAQARSGGRTLQQLDLLR